MLGRITSARHTINELTEDDEDMALMNLTLLKKKPKLYLYVLYMSLCVYSALLLFFWLSSLT